MSIEAVLKQIKDEDVAYVDIRFTDTRGKVQHVVVDGRLVHARQVVSLAAQVVRYCRPSVQVSTARQAVDLYAMAH